MFIKGLRQGEAPFSIFKPKVYKKNLFFVKLCLQISNFKDLDNLYKKEGQYDEKQANKKTYEP